MYRFKSLQIFTQRTTIPTQIRRMASTTTTSPATTIISLDHIVLTVKSIPKAIEWYARNLGMKSEAFVSVSSPDVTRYSLKFGSQKINLHELGKEFEPKAKQVKAGSADLCFLTEDPIKEVRERLVSSGVEMVDLGAEETDEGVVERTGAQGKLRSVYVRDLDGNLVEISNSVG